MFLSCCWSWSTFYECDKRVIHVNNKHCALDIEKLTFLNTSEFTSQPQDQLVQNPFLPANSSEINTFFTGFPIGKLVKNDHYRKFRSFELNKFSRFTLSKNGRKFRDAFVYTFFQASWAKIFDLLRVIAVNGTITIEFYVEFWVTGQNFSLLGPTLLWF